MSDSELRPWATVFDRLSRPWTMRITLAKAMKLRSSLKVDLLGTDAGKTAQELSQDPVKIAEVAFAVTADERAERNCLTEEQFLDAFDGDSYSELFDATMEGVIDFFPKSLRAAVQRVWQHVRAKKQHAEAEVVKRVSVERITQAVDREIDRGLSELDKKLSQYDGEMIRSSIGLGESQG